MTHGVHKTNSSFENSTQCTCKGSAKLFEWEIHLLQTECYCGKI